MSQMTKFPSVSTIQRTFRFIVGSVLTVLFFLVAVPMATAQSANRPDERQLKQDFNRFLRKATNSRFAKEYPGIIKMVLSQKPKDQEIALRMMAASEDTAAIPWIVRLCNSEIPNVRLAAAGALQNLVSSTALRRRDSNFQSMVVLRPRARTDLDLSPLGWLALEFMKSGDASTIAYGITIVRYLNLYELEEKIRNHLQSEHPAVSNTARWVIEALRSQRLYDEGQLKEAN
jgi:hypothetical protein